METSLVTTMRARRVLLTLALLVSLALGGCASQPSSASTGSSKQLLTGDPVLDAQSAALKARPQDRLLWTYRGAAAAMRRGLYTDARRMLDEAVTQLGGIVGKDRSARKARSVFNRESRKTFYGEPYERVMAYYYRAILYWMDGEPDNARACFRSAQLADSDAESKSFSGDYVLLEYLDGLVSTKLGGDGSDAYKRALATPHIAVPPPYSTNANVLFFVEYGSGPTKRAGGEYGEQLQFRLGSSPVQSARIRVANFDVEVAAYDDLNFQATTRGGRVMDKVLSNKADFKKTTDNVGDAAIVSGAVLGSTTHRNNEAALGLVAAGLLSKIFSSVTTPEADTRSWDNLPLFLSFAAIPLPPGQYPATVDFLDLQHHPIPVLSKQITLNIPAAKGDKVVFVSVQSITPQTL